MDDALSNSQSVFYELQTRFNVVQCNMLDYVCLCVVNKARR